MYNCNVKNDHFTQMINLDNLDISNIGYFGSNLNNNGKRKVLEFSPHQGHLSQNLFLKDLIELIENTQNTNQETIDKQISKYQFQNIFFPKFSDIDSKLFYHQGQINVIKLFKQNEYQDLINEQEIFNKLMPQLNPSLDNYSIDHQKKILGLRMQRLGNSLRQYIDKNKNKGFDIQFIQNVLKGIISQLRSIHSKGYIHGNIEPKHILFNNSNSFIFLRDVNKTGKLRNKSNQSAQMVMPMSQSVSIIDLKMSLMLEDKFIPQINGSFNYRPLESILSYESSSNKQDSWAIGLILQEMYFGRCMLPQQDDQTILQILEDKIKTIPNKYKKSQWYGQIEKQYQAIIHKLYYNQDIITEIHEKFRMCNGFQDEQFMSQMKSYGLNIQDISIIIKYKFKMFKEVNKKLELNYDYGNQFTKKCINHQLSNYPQGNINRQFLNDDYQSLKELIYSCLEYDPDRRFDLNQISQSDFIVMNQNKQNISLLANRIIHIHPINHDISKPFIQDFNNQQIQDFFEKFTIID